MKIISKKITSVSVLKLVGSNDIIAEKIDAMHEKIERGEVLDGKTYQIAPSPLSEHSFYVTINDKVLNPGTLHEQRRPLEIFINSKNPNSFEWITALTRLCSAVFRKGGDVTFLAEELKSIFAPGGGFFMPGGIYVPSLAAQIGMVIEMHLVGLGLIQKEAMSEEVKAMIVQKKAELGDDATKNAMICPKCNTKAYVILSGCGTCLDCGYSKCG